MRDFYNGFEAKKGQQTIYCNISEKDECINKKNEGTIKYYVHGTTLIITSEDNGIDSIYMFDETINKFVKIA